MTMSNECGVVFSLAQLCKIALNDDSVTTKERVKNWVKVGLVPIAHRSAGTGNSHYFDGVAVQRVKVLQVLSDANLPAETLRPILDGKMSADELALRLARVIVAVSGHFK